MERKEEKMWDGFKNRRAPRRVSAESYLRHRRKVVEMRSGMNVPSPASSPAMTASNFSSQQPATSGATLRPDFVENFKQVAGNVNPDVRRELAAFFHCVIEVMENMDALQDEVRRLRDRDSRKGEEMSRQETELSRKDASIAQLTQELANVRCMYELLVTGTVTRSLKEVVTDIKTWLAKDI